MPKSSWPTQPGLNGFKKGERERDERMKLGEDLGTGNEYNQNSLYKILKESIKTLLRKFQSAYSVFVPRHPGDTWNLVQ